MLAFLLALAATPVIIDTDMGPDDVMAISLILAHREIPVDAITVVNGIAHVKPGASNARQLVQASGRTGIPVFEGSTRPLQFTREFPAAWRAPADRPLANSTPTPAVTEHADAWLHRRFRDAAHPVRILALGPLTNIAVALASANPKAVEEIVIMGGAFHVPGNLPLKDNGNPVAEGNFLLDPEAAARVFRSGIPLRIVPLDATNRVPIDAAFSARFKASAKGPLAGLVNRVLDNAREEIAHGELYAWDPLAAAALLDPSVLTWTPAHVSLRTSGPDTGRSVTETGAPNARIALDASRSAFERVFLAAFTPR